VKMRGTIKPTPVYQQDIPGLLAWLNQPPSQWSAVGWQNAPAWAALVDKLISDLREDDLAALDAQLELEHIRCEISCRVDHGADSNGHLEAILAMLKKEAKP